MICAYGATLWCIQVLFVVDLCVERLLLGRVDITLEAGQAV